MELTSSTPLAIATMAAFTCAAVTLLYAALHDVAFRTVPNWVSVVVVMAGGLLRAMSGTLIAGLIAGLLVFFGAMFCWRRGWLGGGDVKLLAAATVLVPPSLAGNLLISVALAGGVLAIIYLALARLVRQPRYAARPPGLLRRIVRTEHYRIYRRGPLPYASAIVAGVLFVMLKG